jgi:hypothetical protein
MGDFSKENARMRLNQKRVQYFRSTLALACLASLSALVGCGDGKIKRYPVACTVHVDGKPAAGAFVIFCPVEGPPELLRERPAGIADAEGKFLLTTIGGSDGVPAGKFKVLVQWPNGTLKPTGPGGIQIATGPDRLHHKYFNLDTTPLTATIEADTKELPPFELQSK